MKVLLGLFNINKNEHDNILIISNKHMNVK